MPSQRHIEFAALLDRNSQIIYKICWLYCGGSLFYFDELREQVAIALWCEVNRFGAIRFLNESKESAWVYRIAAHAAARYISVSHNKQLPSIEFFPGLEQHAVDEDPDTNLLLEEIKNQLNDSEKRMLAHYLDNHSCRVIAQQEHISETAARKRMSRLLQKLKTLLNQ